MIKINLMGKQAAAAGAIPFGLDEKLGKLGITVDPAELMEMRPGLIKVGVLMAGLYLANWAPTYFHEQKVKELDAQLNTLNEQSNTLTQELASKKDIRKQMEQLNKEEVELQRQLNAVNALQRDRSLAFRTLDTMVVSMPQKVWLSNMEYRDRTVVLRGSCWEYFPINDFVKSINEFTQFTGVNFRGITSESAGALVPGVPEAMQKIKNFEVEFKVKGAGDT